MKIEFYPMSKTSSSKLTMRKKVSKKINFLGGTVTFLEELENP